MPSDDTSAPPPPLRIGLPSRLGEMLIRQGLVSSEAVQAALSEQAGGSEWRLGRLLVRQGELDDQTLVQAIAHQFHVPVVDLRVEPPTSDALDRLAPSAARRLQALPLRLDADALVVAVSDPPVRELRVAIERCTGVPVRLVLAAADDLATALDDWSSGDIDVSDAAERGSDAASEPFGPPVGMPFAEPADQVGGGPGAAPVAEVNDLQMVVWLLTEAVRREATAVHLDQSADGLRIRYRVDGAIVPGPSLPETSGTVVCRRLLAAASLDPGDDGLHEGAFDTVVDGRSLTCRVTAMTTARATHVVVRPEVAARPVRLEDLGVGGSDAGELRGILQRGRGVLAVAATRPAVAAAVTRTLVDEAGPEDRIVVGALAVGSELLQGAVLLDPDGGAAGVVAPARALGADVLVTDTRDPDARAEAFEAASALLVVLDVSGDDASDVVTGLVADAGAFLVAGMLRGVLVAGGDPEDPLVAVHLVTEDVCRAILEGTPR